MKINNHYDWGFQDGRFIGLIFGIAGGLLLGLLIAHSPYTCHF